MLDAQGDPNAVWVFQMPASTLTLTTPGCNVILENGAQASNIFWQVGTFGDYRRQLVCSKEACWSTPQSRWLLARR